MTTTLSADSDNPASMDDDALAATVSTLAAHIHAATYRLLTLIAELDRREVWPPRAPSPAPTGSDGPAVSTPTPPARRFASPGRSVNCPLLSEALAKGELGYSKVRALTRIATPDNEADLLNVGLHGTAQHVETFARLYRRARRAEETKRADAQHENRGLTFWHEDDGNPRPARAVPARGGRAHPQRPRCGDGCPHGRASSPPRLGQRAWRGLLM